MTLQQIRYILAIAESRSVSLAAKRLFISQPSLSAALKEVEDEFGIRIFNRGREFSITREGKEFLIYARQVMDQMNLLENRFSSRKDFSWPARTYPSWASSRRRWATVSVGVGAVTANASSGSVTRLSVDGFSAQATARMARGRKNSLDFMVAFL